MNSVKINNLMELKEIAIKHRRHLHKYPELSGKEFETCKYIKKQLEKLNIKILDYEAPSVVGFLKGTEGETTIALRADMDALPIVEEGEKSYISEIPGVSHACGHDDEIYSNIARSSLYNLEPIGVGTPNVESFSGYISRLATQHSIRTGDMVAKIIAPLLKKRYLTNQAVKGGEGLYKSSNGLNGLGTLAQDF
ncbi:M20/M25/M40 family metallo-hydrolase [Niallia sp. 03133]|uniref:M20/M25/M40 family metallo-hydrolase n=1 Tax=Niallia sp. 03133 TaxID=3458060 RepID=UPI004043A658